MIDDSSIEYEKRPEVDEEGNPIWYMPTLPDMDEFTSYKFDTPLENIPDGYYESVWGTSATSKTRATGEQLANPVDVIMENTDDYKDAQGQLNACEQKYNTAANKIIEILTNVLQKGKITGEDNAEFLAAQHELSIHSTKIKELCNKQEKDSYKKSVEDIKKSYESTTTTKVLDILTEGGTKPWLYMDDNNNVLIDGTSIPELTMLVKKLNLIATGDGEESAIKLTPQFIELISSSDIKLKASNITLEGLVTANENFKILKDGSIVANNGTFTGKIFIGDNGSVIDDSALSDGIRQGAKDGTLAVEKLEAVHADIKNLKADKANIIDLNATNAQIENLKANKVDAQYLTANYATIKQLDATNANVTNLQANKADITDLNATNAEIENLKTNKADIATLNANVATINQALINKADISVLQANYATIKQLNATNANITSLQTETANINKALIDKADVADLNATNANVTNLQATKANITDLNAAKANINTLTTNLAEITTLVNGNLTSDNIQSMVITGDKFTVADAFIKNAMIDSINASKINAGIINTNNVSIQSNDGSMILQGNLQQFKDENDRVRIQIGKDASGNFTFCLYDENGTGQLINQNGIQSSNAIADGLIVDSKVAANANIAGSKLDIDSVVTEVNNGTTSIKGTKIYLDDQKQSLNVAFNNMSTTVSGNTSTINSHTTSINTMNGKVTQLIADTTITKEDGTTTSLKDAYNATVDTVNSHTQTIGSLETNLNKVSTGQNKWLLEMFEKGDGIDAESPITIKDIMGKTLIKAVLIDDSATSNQSQFGNYYLGRATTYVYLDEDYNWETTATSDDGSTIYINGAAIATLTSCNATPIIVPFKQGWNKITWVYNEGIGGDGWDFNPRLTTLPQVKYMNAYPMTNIDEVGNILDGNIKTVSSRQTTLEQDLNGFKQTVANTYATQTSLNTVDGKFANYSTTSQMNSAINQKANKITSTVSETYTTKTDFNNLQVGGTNLLPKSGNFKDNTGLWTSNGASLTLNSSVTYMGYSTIKIVGNGGTTYNEFIELKPNTTYTYSVLAKASSNIVGNYITPLHMWLSTAQDSQHLETVIAHNSSIGTKWTKAWVTFDTPNNSDIYYMKPFIYNIGDATVWLANAKVEEGNKATDWSPAPVDIDDSIATVDNKFANYSTTSAMNSAINQKANEITSSVSETYTTKSEFNDLDIGGRNFLVGTKNAFTRAINTAEYTTDDPYTTYTSQTLSSLGFKVGDKITVSFDWSLSNVTTAGNFRVETVQDSTYKSLVSGPHNFGSTTIGRYVGTKTLTSSDVSINKIRIRVDTSNLTITIKNMKLEKGDKATSWTPAPEDIDASITAVDNKFVNYSTTSDMNSTINQKANEITQSVSETYATKTALNTVDGKFANYSTTSAMNTAINQKAESITQSVSNTYATKTALNSANNNITSLTNRMSNAESKLTKDSLTTTIGSYYTTSTDVNGLITAKGYATTSQVNQTATDLTAKFTASGGYNLIENSSGYFGVNNWFHPGADQKLDDFGVNNHIDGYKFFTAHKSFYATTSDTTEKFVYSKRFSLKPNTQYTLSGVLSANEHCKGIDVYMITSESQTGASNEIYNLAVRFGTSTWWKKFTYTFTTGANVLSGCIRIDNNGSTTSGTECCIYFGDLLLEEGEVAHPWSPHPNEVRSGITQIDASGIKVYHDGIDSNSYTHMAPAGFYIKNKGTDIFKVDTNGLYVKGNGDFTGKVTANDGSIGGFTISNGKLVGTASSGYVGLSGNGDDWAFWAGSNTGGNAPFHVGHEGNLYATQAYISGTITGSHIEGNTIVGGTIKGTEVTGGAFNVEGQLTANKVVCKDIDSPKYPGAVTEDLKLYVSIYGSDDSELEDGAVFASFDGILDKLPKNLNGHEVRIEMSTDITENVIFVGYHGGRIKVHMKGHTLNGYANSRMGSARIFFYSGYIGNSTNTSNGWGKIHPNKGYAVGNYTTSVACEDSGSISLYNIDVCGADNYLSGSSNKVGTVAATWGTIYLSGVSYYGCDIGSRANAGGRVHDATSYGVCAKYGCQASTGGYITLTKDPHAGGKTANYTESDAGKVIVASGATFATGDVTNPGGTAPVSGSKTVTIKSTSGDTYRSTMYNSYKGDNTVRQGDYGYGNCNGIWFFGDQFDQFKGKNITKVVITINRQGGGQYAAVDLNIKTHNYKTRPNGNPSYVANVGTLGVAANTSASKTITDTNNTIIAGLRNGTIKGIGLQSTYDSSHYAVCSGSVTIKVTYNE